MHASACMFIHSLKSTASCFRCNATNHLVHCPLRDDSHHQSVIPVVCMAVNNHRAPLSQEKANQESTCVVNPIITKKRTDWNTSNYYAR